MDISQLRQSLDRMASAFVETYNHPTYLDIFWLSLGVFILFSLWKKLQNYTKNNLNDDQIRLRAQLIGSLANFILGAGVVSILIDNTSRKIPIPFTSENLYSLLNAIYTILGSLSIWLLMHRYALSLLASSDRSPIDGVSSKRDDEADTGTGV